MPWLRAPHSRQGVSTRQPPDLPRRVERVDGACAGFSPRRTRSFGLVPSACWVSARASLPEARDSGSPSSVLGPLSFSLPRLVGGALRRRHRDVQRVLGLGDRLLPVGRTTESGGPCPHVPSDAHGSAQQNVTADPRGPSAGDRMLGQGLGGSPLTRCVGSPASAATPSASALCSLRVAMTTDGATGDGHSPRGAVRPQR